MNLGISKDLKVHTNLDASSDVLRQKLMRELKLNTRTYQVEPCISVLRFLFTINILL